MDNQIEIFKTKDNQTEIKVRFEQETVWLSQKQIAGLFMKDRSVISKHISNVFKEGELEELWYVQILHIPQHTVP